MTDEQVENFRKVLSSMLGPYAFLMPREEVVAIRDTMQKKVDSSEGNPEGVEHEG